VGVVCPLFSFLGTELAVGRKEEIVEKVRAIAAPLAAGEGLELVDVELAGAGGRTTLRLYIDRDGGVSLEDCSSVSRAVSAALDVEDPIAGAYDLEVSSPGLDRPLRTPEHFEKYAGENVRVKAYGPIPELENRKTFAGALRGFEEGRALIEVDGKLFGVPLEKIAKAHVEPRLSELAASEEEEPEARLQIDGRYVLARSREDVRRALKDARRSDRSEVAVRREGESMTALFTGGQAVLFLTGEEGEPGFSSRNPRFKGSPDARLAFTLSNGQEDEYPASWAVSGEDATRGLEHWFFTGQRPSFIHWHDESGPGTTHN
jgi:ribosome maturation factor RimP